MNMKNSWYKGIKILNMKWKNKKENYWYYFTGKIMNMHAEIKSCSYEKNATKLFEK